jgi:hypothetical protein
MPLRETYPVISGAIAVGIGLARYAGVQVVLAGLAQIARHSPAF